MQTVQCDHMCLKRTATSKRSSTLLDGTNEGFLSRMRHLMALSVGSIGEHLTTSRVTAHVWLLTSMHACMSFHSCGFSEFATASAIRTRINFVLAGFMQLLGTTQIG